MALSAIDIDSFQAVNFRAHDVHVLLAHIHFVSHGLDPVQAVDPTMEIYDHKVWSGGQPCSLDPIVTDQAVMNLRE